MELEIFWIAHLSIWFNSTPRFPLVARGTSGNYIFLFTLGLDRTRLLLLAFDSVPDDIFLLRG